MDGRGSVPLIHCMASASLRPTRYPLSVRAVVAGIRDLPPQVCSHWTMGYDAVECRVHMYGHIESRKLYPTVFTRPRGTV